MAYRGFRVEVDYDVTCLFFCWGFDCMDFDRYARAGRMVEVEAYRKKGARTKYTVEWMRVDNCPKFKSEIICRQYGSRKAYEKHLAQKRKETRIYSTTLNLTREDIWRDKVNAQNAVKNNIVEAMKEIESGMNGHAAQINSEILKLMKQNEELKKEADSWKMLAHQTSSVLNSDKASEKD